MYTVYLIKQDGIPCYVGMTSRTLKERFWEHCKNKKGAMYKPIKKHGKEHFETIKIDHAHAKDEASNKEDFWTLFYKEQGYNLYNRIIGMHQIISETQREIIRNRSTGKHPNDETRRKMSDARQGEKNGMFGKHHTEESRKKMSDSHKREYIKVNHPMYGKHHNEESKRKISEAKKGKCSPHRKKVQCIETKEIFSSMNEAAKIKDISLSNISQVCNGKQKTAGGFHWKFVNAA